MSKNIEQLNTLKDNKTYKDKCQYKISTHEVRVLTDRFPIKIPSGLALGIFGERMVFKYYYITLSFDDLIIPHSL